MHFPLSLGIQYCIYKEFSIYAEAYLQTLCFKKNNDTKFFQLKFVFFEKATKFDKISILLLTNKFEFFVSRYSFELQSLFVWFSVLKLNSLRWLLVYKLSQCLKHSKHCQNLAMFGMFE